MSCSWWRTSARSSRTGRGCRTLARSWRSIGTRLNPIPSTALNKPATSRTTRTACTSISGSGRPTGRRVRGAGRQRPPADRPAPADLPHVHPGPAQRGDLPDDDPGFLQRRPLRGEVPLARRTAAGQVVPRLRHEVHLPAPDAGVADGARSRLVGTNGQYGERAEETPAARDLE